MPSLDPRAVGLAPAASLAVVAYRNQAKGFDPRSGDGARRLGGRSNPPHSFPVLYLCLSRPCVVAELTRQAERQGFNVDALLPRELFEISADLDKLLDLTDASTLDAIGIAPPVHTGDRRGGPRARLPGHPLSVCDRSRPHLGGLPREARRHRARREVPRRVEHSRRPCRPCALIDRFQVSVPRFGIAAMKSKSGAGTAPGEPEHRGQDGVTLA